MDLLDLLLKDGWLIDPERLTMHPGSVGVKDGRIAALYGMGAQTPVAAETVELRGLAVSPGFIDVHAHLDGHFECGRRALRQGITTSFGGNCGLSPIDMDAFYASQQDGFPVNQAEFVGHSFSLRQAAGLTDVQSVADPAQVARMEQLARRALEDGAWGVSFGLDYCPGCGFGGVERLGRLTAEFGAICPIHTRLFTMYDMYSIAEAALLALNTGVQVQVSHLVYQYPMVELLDEAFETIEFAQERGAHICCDSGMYTHFAAPLGSATFSAETMALCGWEAEDLLITTGPHRGEQMTQALFSRLRREEPDTEVVCFSGEEEAIAHAFSRDYVMVSTDAGTYSPGQGHPQAAASFPRFFRVMVREQKRMNWPEAVRRASLLPAETMGLRKKGRLSPGADADLVVFDPAVIADRATFEHPDLPPVGVDRVILGGRTAVLNGEIVNERLGRVLRRPVR